MKAIFHRATGKFAGEKRFEFPTHDDATHVAIDTGDNPTPADARWNGATGWRPANAQEQAADADSVKDGTATLAGNSLLEAVARSIIQIGNQYWKNGQAVTAAQVKAIVKGNL